MTGQQQTMSIESAIETLSDGHNILSLRSARAVCAALGADLPDTLVMHWETREEAQERFGFFATIAPGDGVDSLDLSYHVAKAMGIANPPGRKFTGKGDQAQANSKAIREKLVQIGRLPRG